MSDAAGNLLENIHLDFQRLAALGKNPEGIDAPLSVALNLHSHPVRALHEILRSVFCAQTTETNHVYGKHSFCYAGVLLFSAGLVALLCP